MLRGVSVKGAVSKPCKICKKTFCCAECRDRHVNKVHPGLNGSCSLCASDVLPLQLFESEKLDSENEQLLCHIIDEHLPLHCQLCGDTFESREDFKAFGACKWWSRHCLASPVGFGYLDKKLKQCSVMTDSDSKFYTPSEIYRKTSTPMFAGQKVNVEYATPCIPDFSLKTPKTNSSSIMQCNGTAKTHESQISETHTATTEFFSFMTNEETPFSLKISKDERYSGGKLDVTEERSETADNKAAAIMTDESQMSPLNMDLTCTEGGILRDSPQLDPICEEPDDETPEIIKKVRFSDEHRALPDFEVRIESSCAKSILNTSMEDEDEVYHDADTHVSNTRSCASDATAEHFAKLAENTENEKFPKRDREEDTTCTAERPLPNNLRNDLSVEVTRGNVNDENDSEKENRNRSGTNSVSASTTSQQGTRMLMMLLVENNSGQLNGDFMPLISSGLKKLQEIASANLAPGRVESLGAKTALRRQSITQMQMTVSTVESYSADDGGTAVTRNPRGIEQPSSSSPTRDADEKNGGFLSSFAQAVKHALRSLSGMNVPSTSIEPAKAIEREESVEKSVATSKPSNSGTSLPNLVINAVHRSGKRTRDVSEAPSRTDSLEGRSPLAKRNRRWYTMIKGRKPLRRMRSATSSSRGVSTGTQIFSQGSLTVGDTILPLPARAHQSTQTE